MADDPARRSAGVDTDAGGPAVPGERLDLSTRRLVSLGLIRRARLRLTLLGALLVRLGSRVVLHGGTAPDTEEAQDTAHGQQQDLSLHCVSIIHV